MARSDVALGARGGAPCVTRPRTVGAPWRTGDMAFVPGHARDTGWVVAHVPAPVHAEDGQLALVAGPAEADGRPAQESGPVEGAEPEPVSSARKSAITRS